MKKSNLNLRTWLVLLVLAGLPAGLMAQPQQARQQFRQQDQAGPALPGLTEEQKESIKEIRLETHKVVQPLRDEIAINKAKINALAKKDDPDMEEIITLVETNGKLLTQISVQQIDSRIQIRSLLTEEQNLIWDLHHGRMKGRRGMAGYRPHRGFQQRGRL